MSKKNTKGQTPAGADWKRGFHRAFIDALVADGAPLSDTPSTYGWMADDWIAKVAKVRATAIDYDATTWTKTDWHEFQGTFYEGDTRVFGIDVRLVLTDGTVVKWRWSGSVGDLILSVVNSTD